MAIVRKWEEYHGGPNELTTDRMHVTLNVRCILLLNRKTVEALGRPEQAMLLYDRENQTIGLRRAFPGDVKPFPVTAHPKGSHHSVYIKPFCRHHDILPGEHVRFTDVEIDHNEILTLDLQKTEPVARKRSRERR